MSKEFPTLADLNIWNTWNESTLKADASITARAERKEFAKSALHGLLANGALFNHLQRKATERLGCETFDHDAPIIYASLAIEYADALLSELNAYDVDKEGKECTSK